MWQWKNLLHGKENDMTDFINNLPPSLREVLELKLIPETDKDFKARLKMMFGIREKK